MVMVTLAFGIVMRICFASSKIGQGFGFKEVTDNSNNISRC